METERIATGSKVLDRFLGGGYERDVITTIYGPAGSGKTILAMLCAAKAARSGIKVVYVDTENNFSLERLKQIAPDYTKVLENVVLLRPKTFKDQKDAFAKLKKMVNDKVRLIIVDTIAMLYRLELSPEKNYEVNRELGRQLSDLAALASSKKVPVLLTNQVYANVEKEGVKIVGGDLLRYMSKCLIELQALSSGNRRLILEKHRSIAPREMLFKIVEGGVIGTKEGKFKLF